MYSFGDVITCLRYLSCIAHTLLVINVAHGSPDWLTIRAIRLKNVAPANEFRCSYVHGYSTLPVRTIVCRFVWGVHFIPAGPVERFLMRQTTSLGLFTIISLFTTMGHSAPGFQNGNDLLSNCMAAGAAQANCEGYVAGVMDTLVLLDQSLICIPGTATVEQLKTLALDFFKQHPERRHNSASTLLQEAMQQAFPCPSKPPQPPVLK